MSERWWKSTLRDVSYALRNQHDLTREQIAAAIDRALAEGTPDDRRGSPAVSVDGPEGEKE